MLDRGPPCAVLRLITHPHIERGGFHLDRFDAYLDDALITTSRQPLLDGARVLLAPGVDPNAMLTMRHANRDYDSFEPQAIGEWAQWTVMESDRRGLQRKRWQPFGDASGSERVASPRGDEAPAGRQVARSPWRRSRHAPGTGNSISPERTASSAREGSPRAEGALPREETRRPARGRSR